MGVNTGKSKTKGETGTLKTTHCDPYTRTKTDWAVTLTQSFLETQAKLVTPATQKHWMSANEVGLQNTPCTVQRTGKHHVHNWKTSILDVHIKQKQKSCTHFSCENQKELSFVALMNKNLLGASLAHFHLGWRAQTWMGQAEAPGGPADQALSQWPTWD